MEDEVRDEVPLNSVSELLCESVGITADNRKELIKNNKIYIFYKKIKRGEISP